MAIPISSSITQISPEVLFNDGFELSDQNIIPSEELVGSFIPEKNKVEFYVYDANINILSSNYDFTDWSITQNTDTKTLTSTNNITLNPEEDLYNLGFDVGNLYAVYNFINHELDSNINRTYYISDISSDRTEIRLKSNFISNEAISSSFNDFITRFNNVNYFDEFYISFGNNEYQIGVNAQLETSNTQNSVLIKLYDALPDQYQVKDELYVVTKVAETQAFNVEFEDIPFSLDNLTYLQGPNTNLNIKDIVNNSTTLKSKSELLNTESTSSLFNLQNILNQKGVQLTPNYSYDTFDEFVNFSSAKKRIENFIEKVSKIQTYQSDINTLSTITGSTSSSFQVSSSIIGLSTNIENIIKNFDGYEYYLYYNSSSYAYPKSSNLFPYDLYPVNSPQVMTWLGSDNEFSPYYGGIILSASFYDNNNQNWLYYTIPEFIRDNDNNNQYIEFCNMVGQHFDELWLYTKAITQKLNSTNNLEDGIPLKLAEEAIRSFGFEGLSNNYNNQGTFIGLTGEDDFNYTPPTGSELITQYIAVNQDGIINYWKPGYAWVNYVQQLISGGYPYAIDNVSKEIFKRLYHNMAYLVKKKGTISGLRQLINIWGIPDTILRINEFGGKDQNESTYDQWYNRYSYAYTPGTDSSAQFPWLPLNKNYISESQYIVPDSIEFRFKTDGIPTSSYYTQSLLVKKSDGSATSTNFDFGVTLNYTPITTGSYQGSNNTDYANYGTLRLYISGSAANGGTAVSNDIYLPFFDKGWWSVMLKRNIHAGIDDNDYNTTYTLYAKNKIYNGWDGNIIGFQGSASIVSNISSSINRAWNKVGTGSADGIYLGGYISGSVVGNKTLTSAGKIFLGALQEFRYYSVPLTEEIFNNFTMNPESIEGIDPMGSLSSFDTLNFRAPLGNELESKFIKNISASYSETLTSLHPAISGEAPSLITGSFIIPVSNITSSTYNVTYYGNEVKTYSTPNYEVYFLNQPAMGIRNIINDKIRIADTSDYGNVLSNQISIQQDYQISQSYTEDINSLEVSFSPQDEVNDDIIQSLGFSNIQEIFSDPRTIRSTGDFYNPLRKFSEDYFKKYTKSNIYDYLRLIKYFDNSLFKAIKNYVPARTSVTTGIVIKQHLLERNKYQEPTLTQNSTIAYGSNPAFNTPLIYQNLELTSSIEIDPISGGTGGVVEKFNYSGSPNFFQTPITQSWNNTFNTIAGEQTIIENTEKEFYDGEYSGSELIATTQDIFPNPYAPSNGLVAGDGNGHVVFSLFGNTPEIVVNPLTYLSNPSLSSLNVVSSDGINWNGNSFSINSTNVATSSLVTFNIQGNRISNPALNSLEIGLSSSLGSSPLIQYIFPFSISITETLYSGVDYYLKVIPNQYTAFTASYVLNINAVSDPIPYSLAASPAVEFYNSDYYAIPNNENNNRDNTFLKDIDYSSNPNYPVNRTAIISGNATPAQTPDSNYTTARIINPRYDGSRVSSADYNFYTTPTNSASFQNGDTGSWNGDISYGKTATIDKNPIYFAHFKTSKQSRELWGTYTFEIDALIESPRDSIVGENQETAVIKIEGQNNKLLDISSTFEKNRQVSVNYENRTYSGNSLQIEIDYSNQNQIVPIFQGASEFRLIGGNETGLRTAVTRSCFSMPSWLKANNQNPSQIFTNSTNCLKTGSGTLQLWSKPDNSGISLNTTAFIYTGTPFPVDLYNVTSSNNLLGLIHGYNFAVKNQIIGEVQIASPFPPGNLYGYTVGLPYNTTVDPTNPDNYFNFIPTSSSLSSYENSNLPFLVEKGDEIRVTYNIGTTSLPFFITQDFTVLELLPFTDSNTLGSQAYSCSITEILTSFSRNAKISIYDTFRVYPDPSTLINKIPNGFVTNYTIRRKVDNDQSVIVFQSPPANDQGYQTLSGPGYLIPNDFTETQKRNALTLINNLKAKNAFRDDNDTSISILTP